MAVIQMQKIAVLAHKNHAEELLQFLHKEGVMEISRMKEVGSPDHDALNFRQAELEHAIGILKEYASPETEKAMKKIQKGATEEQILHSMHGKDIRGIIDELSSLEQLDQHSKTLTQGLSPSPSTSASSEQMAYFPDRNSDDLSRVHAGGEELSAEEKSIQLSHAQKQLEKNNERRKALSEHLPELLLAQHLIRWMNEKEAVRDVMQKSKTTVMLEGWIPSDTYPLFESSLHRSIKQSAVIKVKPDPSENMPVYLKNSKVLTPFESVTKLYGLPQSQEMDPTPFLSFFFILFFALCLTDAGYGLVLTVIMSAYLWKTKKSVQDAPLYWLLLLSGVMTFLVSIPFGGWFGLTPESAPSFMTETRADAEIWFKGQIWNLSDQSGIAFLQNLSLALGIIHLSFGILLGVIAKTRSSGIAAGLWQDGTSLLFIGTALLYFLGPVAYKPFFGYAIIISLVLMIWGKGYGHTFVKRPMLGFLQTLNFFLGMMGNVLSYLRILALGLVTGALAFTVNLVAEQISGFLPWFLAIPVAILIYVVGHLMNIALNVLGAFIHSGRLQFVEFFSQFFEGGGKAFKPFTRS